ncbi:37S ribosomal protein S8, mitochondrial [Teratosphaeria destructans]|uniref:37S ribosomal protein S8, mitochondrial n=1 Tax=Teratosphaeria destructans TaxID=418781 RepID=A0A9W7SXB7_9PEZI|nr:37S ribosomal protein S8, mitochondrial [Teratosphaeria destructans]
MSLVNLGHVCSHLQNASLARLGLTSIPYSNLHLSLALLLHKQGFLSRLSIGGPAPPASAFPAKLPDNRRFTAAPHRDRSARSPEAALADVVMGQKTLGQLEAEGYDRETVDWVRDARLLSKEQLEHDGWDTHAIEFVMQHGQKSREQLADEGFEGETLHMALAARERMQDALDLFRTDLAHYNRECELDGKDENRMFEANMTQDAVAQRVRAILRRHGFDQRTLQFHAGPARFATPRHIEQDGITETAMGVVVSRRPVTLLPEQYRDPFATDAENVVTPFNRASRRLWLGLKYWEGEPVLRKARLISKPTKRIHLGVKELGRVVRGGQAGEVKGMRQIGEVVAVSTDRGVMEARECVERKIGGQPLCRVW